MEKFRKEKPNPIMDTIVYEVDLPDEIKKDYEANIITKALHFQLDNEGNE